VKRDSRDLEILVAKIQTQLAPDAVVEHDVKLVGRHIDVLVRQRLGQYEMLVVLDCKDYAHRVDVKAVEEFHGLLDDVGAQRGALIAPKGFTDTAKKRAEGWQIDLYSPVDTDPHKWQVKVAAPLLCDFRQARISIRVRTSVPKPFRMPYDFYSRVVAYSAAGVPLGTPLEAAIANWDDGRYPIEPGIHENLDIYPTTQVLIDNGYGERVPVSLTVSLLVEAQLFFGHLPITQISGFEDHLRGGIITNAFTTGLLDLEMVVNEWQRIASMEDVPVQPMMRLQGLYGWSPNAVA
jgi:hypothetical protein